MHKAKLLTGPIEGIDLIFAHYDDHSFKPHFHFDYHVGLVEYGKQIFHSKGVKHHTGPGAIQLMMPEQVHDSQTLKDGSFFSRIFCISHEWVESLTGKSGFSNVNTFNSSIVNDLNLFQKLLFLHRVFIDSKSSQLGRECAPIELFSELFSRYSNGQIETGADIGTKSIVLLKDYIMTNLQEKISLKDLAQLCDLSKPQFLRHFKKRMGLTPYNWLLLLRLERAMEMLKSGERCTDVAYFVGFYDQPHFINAFQRIYGLKPAEVQRSRIKH